jgi:hypothetical protein
LPQTLAAQETSDPVQGSVMKPHLLAGQVVSGVQHVAWSVFEHRSPLLQFVVQVTFVLVHASVNVPQ